MKHLHKTNLTPEQRQARYLELHPTYDHSQTDFTAHGTQSIDVSCPQHGPFVTTAKLHIKQLTTCPECLKQSKLLQPPTWHTYRSKEQYDMIAWYKSFDMTNVQIVDFDKQQGSPKLGDFIAKSKTGHLWLIPAKNHKLNYELIKEK